MKENERKFELELNTHGDSDIISSMLAAFFRHDVGQALKNVCYRDITFLVR